MSLTPRSVSLTRASQAKGDGTKEALELAADESRGDEVGGLDHRVLHTC
jgi:hypothetical protein